MKTHPLLVSVVALALSSISTFAQTSGQFDEVFGKEVRNFQGKTLGYVVDTAIDLTHGRYFGMVVKSGGFLGMGAKTVIIPPAALKDTGTPRVLYLDMDPERFANAPTLTTSKEVGPPEIAKAAEVYRFFGQVPYFGMKMAGPDSMADGKEMLGYVRKGSEIIGMPVENLQGVTLGSVAALRRLNRVTGRLEGVVIRPASGSMKIVPPTALRYNLRRDRLRLNDNEQPFRERANIAISSRGETLEESMRSETALPPPLVTGDNDRDRAITLRIRKQILKDPTLSHYAKNIEVATVQGKTTLRGRVQTAAGRDRIVGYAIAAAGEGNVTVLLEVRPQSEAEKAIDR
jgi:sporulation protein YlmC with PRC-barrel domain